MHLLTSMGDVRSVSGTCAPRQSPCIPCVIFVLRGVWPAEVSAAPPRGHSCVCGLLRWSSYKVKLHHVSCCVFLSLLSQKHEHNWNVNLLVLVSGGRLNGEARQLFDELGSTAAKELAFRDSWVFVGAKGIENKSPFEQVLIVNSNITDGGGFCPFVWTYTAIVVWVDWRPHGKQRCVHSWFNRK